MLEIRRQELEHRELQSITDTDSVIDQDPFSFFLTDVAGQTGMCRLFHLTVITSTTEKWTPRNIVLQGSSLWLFPIVIFHLCDHYGANWPP